MSGSDWMTNALLVALILFPWYLAWLRGLSIPLSAVWAYHSANLWRHIAAWCGGHALRQEQAYGRIISP